MTMKIVTSQIPVAFLDAQIKGMSTPGTLSTVEAYLCGIEFGAEYGVVKTIGDWSKHYDVTILDPDGFDRSDPVLQSRLFTRAEFLEGMEWSTVRDSLGRGFSRIQEFLHCAKCGHDETPGTIMKPDCPDCGERMVIGKTTEAT